MSSIRRSLQWNFIIIFAFTFFYFFMARSSGEHFQGLGPSSSLVDTVYFAFTVQSTVGFGDIYPKSKLAKTLVMLQQTLLIIGLVDLLSSGKAVANAPVVNTTSSMNVASTM